MVIVILGCLYTNIKKMYSVYNVFFCHPSDCANRFATPKNKKIQFTLIDHLYPKGLFTKCRVMLTGKIFIWQQKKNFYSARRTGTGATSLSQR